jgi:hypothetical protein
MSQLRKRKWTPSFASYHQCTPMSSHGDGLFGVGIATGTIFDDIPRPHKDRCSQSSTTERVVGTFKNLLRRDSHQSEDPLLPTQTLESMEAIIMEHVKGPEDMTDGEYSIEERSADGMANLPHVSQFFDLVGEDGPSNYYKTDTWMKFQSYIKGHRDPENKHDRQNIKRHCSADASLSAHQSNYNTRAVHRSTKKQSPSKADADGLQSYWVPHLSAWRSVFFGKRPVKLSKKKIGKQPEEYGQPNGHSLGGSPPIPRSATLLHDVKHQTTSPISPDTQESSINSIPSSQSSHDSLQQSSLDTTNPNLRNSFLGPTRKRTKCLDSAQTLRECYNHSSSSDPATIYPRSSRLRLTRVLSGRPITDGHYLQRLRPASNNAYDSTSSLRRSELPLTAQGNNIPAPGTRKVSGTRAWWDVEHKERKSLEKKIA